MISKAAIIIKLVGMVLSVAIAFFAPDKSSVAVDTSTTLFSAALILIATPISFFLTSKNALFGFALDLIVSALAFAWAGGNQEAYLYIIALSLMCVGASCKRESVFTSLLLFLLSTFALQYQSMQGEFVREPLYNFLQASHWLNLAGAGLAFLLSGLALREKTDLNLLRICSFMLIAWTAIMLFANDLAGHVKYKGELITETNFHQTCLVIAVLLLLLLGRVKRAFSFVLLSAVIAFFLTVAATYVMVNGFQVIYFLALARISLLQEGNNLKSKISMVFVIIAFLLSTQINPAGVFPHAITGSAQLFMLKSFTYPQMTGLLFAIIALAIVGLKGRTEVSQRPQEPITP